MVVLAHTDRERAILPPRYDYLKDKDTAVYAIITALAFIAVLGVLVLIHELGHFLTARLFGVRVEEFGLGFPPRVYPSAAKARAIRERGGTVYSLNALPLGGFVRLAGENGVASPRPEAVEDGAEGATTVTPTRPELSLSGQVAAADDPGAFANKPAWQRIIILVAGAFNNMVLAMALVFLLLAVIGTPRTLAQVAGVEVSSPTSASASPAARAGLRPGDIIRSVNGRKLGDASDLRPLVFANEGRPVAMTVTRGDKTLTVTLTPRRPRSFAEDAGPIGVVTSPSYEHNVPIDAGRAASTAVNVPVAVVQALSAIPAALFNHQPASFGTPSPSCDVGTRYLTFGDRRMSACNVQKYVRVPGAVQDDTCLPTATDGVAVTGPVGILRQVGCEANGVSTRGWTPLLTLVIELSATLAVMNLLPFPALDGGRILFVLISLVGRRRVRPEAEALVHALGMAALLTLIFIISVHDISNWFTNRPTF